MKPVAEKPHYPVVRPARTRVGPKRPIQNAPPLSTALSPATMAWSSTMRAAPSAPATNRPQTTAVAMRVQAVLRPIPPAPSARRWPAISSAQMASPSMMTGAPSVAVMTQSPLMSVETTPNALRVKPANCSAWIPRSAASAGRVTPLEHRHQTAMCPPDVLAPACPVAHHQSVPRSVAIAVACVIQTHCQDLCPRDVDRPSAHPATTSVSPKKNTARPNAPGSICDLAPREKRSATPRASYAIADRRYVLRLLRSVPRSAGVGPVPTSPVAVHCPIAAASTTPAPPRKPIAKVSALTTVLMRMATASVMTTTYTVIQTEKYSVAVA